MTEAAANEARELRYRRVLEVITQTPWMVLPATLELIVEIVTFRVEGGRQSDEEIAAKLEAAAPQQQRKLYGTVAGSGGNVAVLPVYGVIMPRATLFSEISGGASMNQFQAAFQQAMDDPSVSAILLDFDSPGGNSALVPETAQMIRSARGQGKPIVAIADTLCASAAYYLASQADEVVASPSALVGSIGVYAAHQDISALQQGLGVKTTLISAGKYKTEGNQYEPLSADAQAAIQSLVDDAYDSFVSDVAKGRGVTPAAVRGGFGQGRVVPAKQAVAEGLADRVGTIDETIARLAHAPSRARVGTGTSAASAEHELELQAAALHAADSAPDDEGNEPAGGAVPVHSTEVVDKPWDGPGAEAKLDEPITKARGFGEYAWYDPDGDDPDGDGYPDAKADWKFPHHEVDNGDPGAANLNGCQAGLDRLSEADIPDGDRAGVRAHLQRHIDDFHARNRTAAARATEISELAASLRQTETTLRERTQD